MLALLAVALACGVAGCGEDDDGSPDAPSAQRTQTSTTGAPPGGAGGGGARPGDAPSGDGRDEGSPAGGSSGDERQAKGGGPSLRSRSLRRYLAARYRQTPWYGEISRVRVRGGHVLVRMTIAPDSEDDSSPALACTAVRSYGRGVERVTVYGSPAGVAPTAVLKEC